MSEQLAFWQTKTLDEMSEAEWESLCDGCGLCCLNKLIDENDQILYTNVACNQLDAESCQCRNYANRFELEPDCIKLTQHNLRTINWLPETCAYRLIDQGQPLPDWHPLIAGTKELMHQRLISMRNRVVYEKDVICWEDHII